MGNVVRTLVLVTISTLAACSICRADLATCYVLRGSDARLDGDVGKKASAAIYRAHGLSDHSDQEMVFVLSLYKSPLKKGAYSIREAKLVLGTGNAQTLYGYELTASHPEGIQNAVAEIEKAFKAGRIFELKYGEREGPIKTPLYTKPQGDPKQGTPADRPRDRR